MDCEPTVGVLKVALVRRHVAWGSVHPQTGGRSEARTMCCDASYTEYVYGAPAFAKLSDDGVCVALQARGKRDAGVRGRDVAGTGSSCKGRVCRRTTPARLPSRGRSDLRG
jgi:hypothetical protein